MSRRGSISRRRFLGSAALIAAAPAAARPELSSAPEIGVCRSIDDAGAVKAGGGRYVEISCGQWLVADQDEAAFAARLRRIRAAALPAVAANGFLPGRLACLGQKANHDAVLDYASIVFARAQAAGIEIVTFGSGAARRTPDGLSRVDADLQFAALLARMGDRARAHDVTVCVEPLQSSETNYINGVDHAARLVGAVRHPNIGITADFFHMMREDDGPGSIIAAGGLIRHVHLAEKRERTPPGVDGDDFRPYLEALKRIGYRGRMSIECRWRDLAAEAPRAVKAIERQAQEVWS